MDMSMILGLTLASSIVLLSGNKNQKTNSPKKSDDTELIVRLSKGDVAVVPKR